MQNNQQNNSSLSWTKSVHKCPVELSLCTSLQAALFPRRPCISMSVPLPLHYTLHSSPSLYYWFDWLPLICLTIVSVAEMYLSGNFHHLLSIRELWWQHVRRQCISLLWAKKKTRCKWEPKEIINESEIFKATVWFLLRLIKTWLEKYTQHEMISLWVKLD